jgi:hypothetical protein
MTLEGVGETSGLADALSILGVSVGILFVRLKSFDAHYFEADFQSCRRLSFRSIRLTSSAAHAPQVVQYLAFFILTFLSDGLACCC